MSLRPVLSTARRRAWPAGLLAGLLVCWPGIAVADPTTPPPPSISPGVSAPTSAPPTTSASPVSSTGGAGASDASSTEAAAPPVTDPTPPSPSARTTPEGRAVPDVAMTIELVDPVALPGQQVNLFTKVEGTGVDPDADFGYTVTLPTEVTLVGSVPNSCTSTNPRLLHCASGPGEFVPLTVDIATGLAPGAEVILTSTLDPVPGDPNTGNDTAVARVLVISRTDLQLRWDRSDITVAPGARSRTRLTVTNTGRWPRPFSVFVVYLPPSGLDEAIRVDSYPTSCDPDIYEFACPLDHGVLAPGKSATFDFTWRLTGAALGRDYPIDVSLHGHEDQESDLSNDTSRLIFHIRRAAASTSASAAASPAATSESTATPVLADTGGPGSLPLGLALGALTVGLAAWRTRRPGRHG